MFCRFNSAPVLSLKQLFDKPRKVTAQTFCVNKARTALPQNYEEQIRYNPIKIQMLSHGLHRQIFGKVSENNVTSDVLKDVRKHLESHGLLEAETTVLPEVNFNLPKLHNSNVIDHFDFIAKQLLKDYENLLAGLLNSDIPPLPKTWEFKEGWTKYSPGKSESVSYPEESAVVFDVEVCMQEGNYPTLATAVSNKHWYLWCSKRLTEDEFSWSKNVSLSDLIPLETSETKMNEDWMPKLVVGHNVAFDRAFIKEQYFLEQTKAMFLDTMSLHMCVSGLTGMQRAMSIASKKNPDMRSPNFFTVLGWSDISSLNNLADVYNLYCEGELKKSKREIFVSGTLADVKNNFQDLATYCATDTLATYEVLKKVMPMFYERFPHPVTLYGLLEMSTAYLPVNQNWEKYLQESQSTYDDLQKELKLSLMHLANDACSLLHNDLYKKDPWLWNLNWETQDIKFRKTESAKSKQKKRKKKTKDVENSSDNLQETQPDLNSNAASDIIRNDLEKMDASVKQLYESASSLRKIRAFLPGYPVWYRELCDKNDADNPEWEPGPILISSQMRCVPKLMRMTWDGYPLHHDAKHGWGYLVPKLSELEFIDKGVFPLRSLLSLLYAASEEDLKQIPDHDAQFYWAKVKDPHEEQAFKYWREIISTVPSNKSNFNAEPHHGIGPHDIGIKGCLFYRLPHKDGPQNRVGNPLSKDFLPKMEDGTLKTWGKGQADRALLLSKMLSYWKNAHGRILSQMVVWFNQDELPAVVRQSPNYDDNNSYGAILPRLIPAGTVTRRAVEPTWLTASNAYEDRVGSELKSMIHSPPGYHFVGADVDSQELWLAALFGDSHFAKCHGATAFGWMTLQGKKSAGTDMHSRTASTVGIGRDQAKILNYARIYGAGKTFAQRLLMQFNHRLTALEVQKKVKKMYSETKGVRRTIRDHDETEEDSYIFTPGRERRIWVGGSESHMFNKLEEIALSKTPMTPALNCRISRALEPKAVDQNFMTSRINWVVQSSAVDFLHLMLVCMKWLFKEYRIQGRYSICIHDEVRYLVKSEDRYRAALALQITNLLTRSFFTAKVGINDLPQSVAFFSSVDIDSVLRKEVHMDSKTPSNPHGLHKGYGIPPGEALDIFDILQQTNGSLLPQS